jgi:hypothetical protein
MILIATSMVHGKIGDVVTRCHDNSWHVLHTPRQGRQRGEILDRDELTTTIKLA